MTARALPGPQFDKVTSVALLSEGASCQKFLVRVEEDLHATPLVLFKESENGERCKRV